MCPLGPGRPQNNVGLIGLSMLVIHQISHKIQEKYKLCTFSFCSTVYAIIFA